MNELTAKQDTRYVGIYPEDLFSNDWWSAQVTGSDQVAMEGK